MCYATKRKIADCVKQLMRKKEIRKITIQDIMDGTKMSRQSFYYHFKDIYDVLEWVVRYDFASRITCQENQSMEEWIVHVFRVLEEERPFFERIVNEMEWPKLLPAIAAPIEEQIRVLMRRSDRMDASGVDFDFCERFATTAYCYYLMDYIYNRKRKTEKELISETHSLLMVFGTSPAFRTFPARAGSSRMVG